MFGFSLTNSRIVPFHGVFLDLNWNASTQRYNFCMCLCMNKLVYLRELQCRQDEILFYCSTNIFPLLCPVQWVDLFLESNHPNGGVTIFQPFIGLEKGWKHKLKIDNLFPLEKSEGISFPILINFNDIQKSANVII